MPSNLYLQAFTYLSEDEKIAFGRFVAWLESPAGTAGRPPDGVKVLENLRAEAHLVGDGAFGDPSELTAFLRRFIDRFVTAPDPPEQHRCYEKVCNEFSGRGLRVLREHLPDVLLRYSTSRRLLGQFIEQRLGDQGLADFQQGLLSPEKAFELLAADWDSSQLSEGSLGISAKVFATFEHAGDAPRNDATAMSRALALLFWGRPRTSEEILFELSYPTDTVNDPRFPTVAEVGWSSMFQPAEERPVDPGDPRTWYGWTRPLGSHDPQPEIVHDNAPVAVVQASPRWVGRIPL